MLGIILYLLLIIVALGIPVETWSGFTVIATAVALLFCGSITGRMWRWAAAAGVVAIAVAVRLVMAAPQIDEGHNVFTDGSSPIYEQGLPAPVLARLRQGWRDANYPAPERQVNVSPAERLFAFSPESLWTPSPLSRIVGQIDYPNRATARLSAFSDNRWDTYNQLRPARPDLPFYIRWDFPASLAGREDVSLCWKGDVFLKDTAGEFQLDRHDALTCRPLAGLGSNAAEGLTVWAVEAEPGTPLSVHLDWPWTAKIGPAMARLAAFLAAAAVIGLLSVPVDLRRLGWILAGMALTVATSVAASRMMLLGLPLFEGGNDGLNYAAKAGQVLAALQAGEWMTAWRGSEAVYDLMPWHRYAMALNYAVFGQTLFGYLLICALWPVAIYGLTRRVLNERWAKVLIVFFILTPAFEAFGFFLFYLLQLMVRGFSEPLSYICFVAGLILALDIIRGRRETQAKPLDLRTAFLCGLCFAGAVGVRPNVAPGAAVVLLAVGLSMLWRKRPGQAAALIVGFLPIGLIPLHNWVFGGVFVPFTIAAQKTVNLAVLPADYPQMMLALLRFDFAAPVIGKILAHIGAEIRPSEVWYHLALIGCVVMVFRPKTEIGVRIVGLTALAMQSLTLFYHVGGRYGHLTWTLTLLVFLVWFKDVILPWWRHVARPALPRLR